MKCSNRTLHPPLNLLRTSLSCSSVRFLRLYSTNHAVRTSMRANLALTASSQANPLRSSPQLLKALNATAGSQSNVANSETTEWAMQDFYGLRKDVQAAAERVEEVRAATGLGWLEADRSVLERKAADSSLWDDPPKAQKILLALTDVKDKIKQVKEFKSQVEEAETIVKLTEELDSIDAGLLEEASKIIRDLNKALNRFELTQLLSGPYDKEGATIAITAGAGGTDAQDWADMLLRMYVRWGEKQGYKTWVVEKSLGDEAGIKSATIEIEGRFAYGYLSGEKGTHRIVRQSPFNSKGLRQTSFAGVEVMPLLREESINLDIPEEDLDISFSRAGGKGGQNVNKVETAVRIVHISTGVTVRCTEERSQLANKIKALSRLKAKFFFRNAFCSARVSGFFLFAVAASRSPSGGAGGDPLPALDSPSDFPPLRLVSDAAALPSLLGAGPVAARTALPSSPLSWRNIVNSGGGDKAAGFNLSFVASEGEEVSFLEEDLSENHKEWELSLIGYALGRKPFYGALLDAFKRKYQLVGGFDLLSLEDDFFLFKFSCREDYLRVFDGGPCFLNGRLFFFKKWSWDFRPVKEDFTEIPLWIKLPKFPLLCWDKNSISHVASRIEERSQLANKIKALSRLKAKLLVIAEEQRAAEIKQIRGDAVKAEWGQQIRNYVFHPYKLVKDLRTGNQTSDATSVMDGDLESFIKAYLKYKYSAAASEESKF